jgi:membrane protein implicated in regulation of membrane protease activity
MNAGINVVDIIFQLVALAVPIIFIIILSFSWRSSKKRTKESDQIDQKIHSMENKIKKWVDYRE